MLLELGRRVVLPLLREMPELLLREEPELRVGLLLRDAPELRLELPLLREIPELRLELPLLRDIPELRVGLLLRDDPELRLELPLPREIPELRLVPPDEREEPLEPPMRELPPLLRPPTRCASIRFAGAAKIATAATANRKNNTRLGVSINDLLSGPTRGKAKGPGGKYHLPVRGPFLARDDNALWRAD